jgi:hypothetical protein
VRRARQVQREHRCYSKRRIVKVAIHTCSPNEILFCSMSRARQSWLAITPPAPSATSW